jgi:hypothetical protein
MQALGNSAILSRAEYDSQMVPYRADYRAWWSRKAGGGGLCASGDVEKRSAES